MQLKYVTLTGADETVDPRDLVLLSEAYPFVEWGILSKAYPYTNNPVVQNFSSPRYPDHKWISEVLQVSNTKPVKMSIHLCGKWVDDAMENVRWVEEAVNGHIKFFGDPSVKSFRRVQLNMSKNRLPKAMDSAVLWNAIRGMTIPIIIGGNYALIEGDQDLFKLAGALPLFDASGGKGELPQEWPRPFRGVLCGYAGGLGPKNLEYQMEKIQSIVSDKQIWIDMESSLRNEKDEFDIDKCKEVLEIAKKWVHE